MLLLVEDTLGTLDVDDVAAYVTETLQLPLPVVRDAVRVKAEAHGTWDQTAYVGARAVTASVVCFADDAASLQERVDALRAYLRPSLRFALVWEDSPGSGVRRRLTVRAHTHEVIFATLTYVRTALGLIAPNGLIESDELHAITILPAGIGGEPGRTYNLVFPRVYPTAGVTPAERIVTNVGSAATTAWVARLYGPCSNPVLTNVTVGEQLAFVGLTLAAGVYVELDAAAHTALLNSNPALSVYDRLNPAVSSWWPLVPGDNRVSFAAGSSGPGTQAVIEWRDAWL